MNLQKRTLTIGDVVTIQTISGNKKIKITSFNNNNNILGYEFSPTNLGGAGAINSYPIASLKMPNNQKTLMGDVANEKNNNIKIYDPYGAIFNESIFSNQTRYNHEHSKREYDLLLSDFKSINTNIASITNKKEQAKAKTQKKNEYLDKWSNYVISIIFKKFNYNINEKMSKRMTNWMNKCIFRLKSFLYRRPKNWELLNFYKILANKLENTLKIPKNTSFVYDNLLILITQNNKVIINNIIKFIINKYKNQNKALININSECYTLNNNRGMPNINNGNGGADVNNINANNGNANNGNVNNFNINKNILQKSLIKSIIYELHNIKCSLYKSKPFFNTTGRKIKIFNYLPNITAIPSGLLGEETRWQHFHKYGLSYNTNEMENIFFMGYFYSIITQIHKDKNIPEFKNIFDKLKSDYPNIIRAGVLFLRYKLLAELLIKRHPEYGTNVLVEDDLITDFRNIISKYFIGGTSSIIDTAIHIFIAINYKQYTIKSSNAKYAPYKEISELQRKEMEEKLYYISGEHLGNILNNLEDIFIFYIPEISNHISLSKPLL